jgi:hypothetical protein
LIKIYKIIDSDIIEAVPGKKKASDLLGVMRYALARRDPKSRMIGKSNELELKVIVPLRIIFRDFINSRIDIPAPKRRILGVVKAFGKTGNIKSGKRKMREEMIIVSSLSRFLVFICKLRLLQACPIEIYIRTNWIFNRCGEKAGSLVFDKYNLVSGF